jgi:predicted acyltransferase
MASDSLPPNVAIAPAGTPKTRLLSLDQFRGLAVLLMIFANSPEHYQNVSPYLKHALLPSGFHLPDIVAPMFLFAIGYAAELSFQSRRKKNGAPKTVLHFLSRNCILFACGFLGTLLVRENRWDILQTLGTAGLMALPLLFLRPAPRWAIALVIAVAFQMTLMGCFGAEARHFVAPRRQPFPFALFCLLFILISGSCLSAWLKGKPCATRMIWLAAAGTILLLAEYVFTLWVPFRKGTLSFALLTAGTSAYLLLLFTLLSERLRLSIQPLEALGRNALLCYMLSSVLILAERALLAEDVSATAAMAGFGGVMALTYLAATILDRRGIYLKL